MNTISTYDEGLLTIAIHGRVDGSQAAKLQEDINRAMDAHDDINEVVIDATEMTFISSMGMRTLLQLRQKQEELHIIGCREEVYNVFRMTGFTHIFNIEKALPQMSIEGLAKVPGMVDFYQLTDETMLKLFPTFTTKEDVDREVELAKAVLIVGVTTPLAFEKVKVGERFGLVYESITPTEVDARTFGDVVRDLHGHTMDPDGQIPSSRDREKAQIKGLQPFLGDDAVSR